MKLQSRFVLLLMLVSAVVFGVLAPLPTGASLAAEISAEQVIARVDALMESPSVEMIAEMVVRDQNKEQISRMRILSKKDKNNKERLLIHYLSPARDKGTGFLMLGDINNMWMYLPKVEKVVRIAGSMVKNSMMGSDFSYEDLMDPTKFAEDYMTKLVGTEKQDGVDTYFLEANAKTGKAPYRKVKIWVRQDSLTPARYEYYRGSGVLQKVAISSDLKTMGGRLIPTRITFKDLAIKNHETSLILLEVKFDAEIPDNIFNLNYLEKEM